MRRAAPMRRLQPSQTPWRPDRVRAFFRLATVRRSTTPPFWSPLLQKGIFDIGPGGRLIRHQDHPEPESVDIGERFLTIRREAYENTVPIPEDMAKVFALLRTIVTRRDLSPPEASGGVMRADDGGWRIDPKIGTESELRVSAPWMWPRPHGYRSCGQRWGAAPDRIYGTVMRIVAWIALVAGLALAVVSEVRINSDATAILGGGAGGDRLLDRPAARKLLVALEGDAEDRIAAARAVAERLGSSPLIKDVRIGPAPPSRAFLDWIWERRFRLSPPDPRDLTPEALARRLTDAQRRMAQAEGPLIADLLLKDPTGSFSRVLSNLDDRAVLGHREGVWQSSDGTAAILFATLRARPFDAEEVAALGAETRALAEALGTTAVLLGPRIVAAEVNEATRKAATEAATIAMGLLLVWLIWSLRSVQALGTVFLPLGVGLLSAALFVQFLFGSVHVIALGFGGALTGLALDYPIHAMAHHGRLRGHARRLILIGAATTAIGFLALAGSGTVALMQTGVFVGSGLVCSAVVTLSLRPPNLRPGCRGSLPRIVVPHRGVAEAALLAVSLGILTTGEGAAERLIFEPPDAILAKISRVREMIDLPSGRYSLETKGDDLAELLEAQNTLRPVLDRAIGAGELAGYSMLAGVLGGRLPDHLPAGGAFETAAAEGLRLAGMSEAYATVIRRAYDTALEAREIAFEDLASFEELEPLLFDIERGPILRETVHLTGIHDLERLRERLLSHGFTLSDTVGEVRQRVEKIRHAVVLWLGIGAVAAVSVLLVLLPRGRLGFRIALTTAAALSLTAAVSHVVLGGLGVFQIAALTLVMGIGIDYGLFLRGADREREHRAAEVSVLLCAGSTIIAFGAMAFSPVQVLHQIGVTVSLGVGAMLLLHTVKDVQPMDPNEDIGQ